MKEKAKMLMLTQGSNAPSTYFTALLLITVFTEVVRTQYCEKDANPDACRNATEMIASKGYPVEEHAVLTRDGYILFLQRIPFGRSGPSRQSRPVVFLQHGLFDSSIDWVMNYPHQSLGYILADAGYDVWLGNVRGNDYSSHITYTKRKKKFWDFSNECLASEKSCLYVRPHVLSPLPQVYQQRSCKSRPFDEMIAIDLPTMIDYVLERTGHGRLIYVGHSQGTMIMFGLLAQFPKYNKKIKLFVALAPVAYLGHLTSPLRLIAPFGRLVWRFLGMIGMYDLFGATEFFSWLRRLTSRSQMVKKVLLDQFYFYAGLEPLRYNMLVMSKGFKKFNYGPLRNRRRYGRWQPPNYDLSRVTAPTAIFYSLNDWLSDTKDVRKLVYSLPNVVMTYQVADPQFTHIDFTLSLLASRFVYPTLLRLLNVYGTGPE
ncbi:lipase 3-like isoform X2 [Haemaphysalis longicornis]